MTILYGKTLKDGEPNGSPFVIRIAKALKHKGIAYTEKNLGFTEVAEVIPKITNGEHRLVPTIVFDDGSVVYESGKIARYLEEKYPSNPLFPNGDALATFFENYFAYSILTMLFLPDLANELKEYQKNHLFGNIEKYFGKTFDQFIGDKEENRKEAEKFMYPLRNAISKSPYFEGEYPTYSDYIVYGTLKTLQMVSKPIFDELVTDYHDQSLKVWFDKIDNIN